MLKHLVSQQGLCTGKNGILLLCFGFPDEDRMKFLLPTQVVFSHRQNYHQPFPAVWTELLRGRERILEIQM